MWEGRRNNGPRSQGRTTTKTNRHDKLAADHKTMSSQHRSARSAVPGLFACWANKTCVRSCVSVWNNRFALLAFCSPSSTVICPVFAFTKASIASLIDPRTTMVGYHGKRTRKRSEDRSPSCPFCCREGGRKRGRREGEEERSNAEQTIP